MFLQSQKAFISLGKSRNFFACSWRNFSRNVDPDGSQERCELSSRRQHRQGSRSGFVVVHTYLVDVHFTRSFNEHRLLADAFLC